MHLRTKKNLHSHQYQSPLSQKQEVSAFGEDGEGDEGMCRTNGVRRVMCTQPVGVVWMRDSIVRFKHVARGNTYFHIGRPSTTDRCVPPLSADVVPPFYALAQSYNRNLNDDRWTV